MSFNEMKTPRGTKIKLSQNFCEGLELKQGLNLNRIFQKIEKTIALPTWTMFFVSLYVFFTHTDPIIIMIVTFSVSFIFRLAWHVKPIFFICKVLNLTEPSFWPAIMGWFIDKIVLIIIGVFTVGWLGVLLYLAGLAANSLLSNLINWISAMITKRKYSFFMIWGEERLFIWFLLESMSKKITYKEWINKYTNYLKNATINCINKFMFTNNISHRIHITRLLLSNK